MSRSENEGDAAATLAAFLAWPAPRSASVRPARGSRPARHRGLASVLITGTVCLIIGACSWVAPLAGTGIHGWSLGGRLLLLCHLG